MWIHRLTERDLINRTALCAHCGPVKIKVRKNGSPACYVKHKEYRRNHLGPRKKTASMKEKIDYIRRVKDTPCMDCGVRYPFYVMEFDHREPSEKLFDISQVRNRSLEVAIVEIAKCDLVCANCHRERTHGKRHPKCAPTQEG